MCMRVEALVYVQYNENTLTDQLNRPNIMGVSAFPAAVSSVLGSHGVLWWFQETSRLSSAGQSWCFIFSIQIIPQRLFIQTQMPNVCHEWIRNCKVLMLNTTTMVYILSVRLLNVSLTVCVPNICLAKTFFSITVLLPMVHSSVSSSYQTVLPWSGLF